MVVFAGKQGLVETNARVPLVKQERRPETRREQELISHHNETRRVLKPSPPTQMKSSRTQDQRGARLSGECELPREFPGMIRVVVVQKGDPFPSRHRKAGIARGGGVGRTGGTDYADTGIGKLRHRRENRTGRRRATLDNKHLEITLRLRQHAAKCARKQRAAARGRQDNGNTGH